MAQARIRDFRLTRRSVVISGLAAGGSLLVACGNDSNAPAGTGTAFGTSASSSTASGTSAVTGTATGQSGQAEDPKGGGTLTFGIRTEPDTLDPHKTVSEYTARILTNVLDTLVQQGEDLSFQPGLAKRWEFSGDGLTLTLDLRDDVKFHDNTDFTADAVKFTFDRIVDPATQSKSAIGALGPYENANIVDTHTVEIHLNKAFGPLLTNLASPYLAPISPSAVQELGDEFGSKPVGAGPYKVKEWVRKERITLEKFEEYNWSSSLADHDGPGYLDSIVFRIVPEDGTRLAALETGEAEIIEYTPAQEVDRLKGDSKYQVHVVQRPGLVRCLPINITAPPTDDLAVRQAILYAIDQEAVNQTVNFGVNAIAYGPLSPVTFGYDPAVEERYHYDLDQAKKLLDDAGWKPGSNGIREKDGTLLKLRFVIWSSAELGRIAENVQAQLREAGIDAAIESPDYAAAVPIYVQSEHNIGAAGYVMTDPDVLDVIFNSDQISTALNKCHFQDPEFDALVGEAAATVDADKRKELYTDAQKIIMDQALIKPLYVQTGITTASAKVQGLAFNAGSYEVLYDVWLKD